MNPPSAGFQHKLTRMLILKKLNKTKTKNLFVSIGVYSWLKHPWLKNIRVKKL